MAVLCKALVMIGWSQWKECPAHRSGVEAGGLNFRGTAYLRSLDHSISHPQLSSLAIWARLNHQGFPPWSFIFSVAGFRLADGGPCALFCNIPPLNFHYAQYVTGKPSQEPPALPSEAAFRDQLGLWKQSELIQEYAAAEPIDEQFSEAQNNSSAQFPFCVAEIEQPSTLDSLPYVSLDDIGPVFDDSFWNDTLAPPRPQDVFKMAVPNSFEMPLQNPFELVFADMIVESVSSSVEMMMFEESKTSAAVQSTSPIPLSESTESSRSISCSWPSCLKSFSTMASYNHHSRYHTLPFQCQSCSSRCATKRELARHVNSRHAKIDKYFCNFGACSKFFFRKDNCVRHRKTHTKTERRISSELG